MSHPYYDLGRADTSLRPCGPCNDSKHDLCIGLAFNSTEEPCPCNAAGHEAIA